MDSENTSCNDVIHNRLKKCGFCGKELQPIGLDYLYANISEDSIEYERCDCSKSKEYWKEIDNKEYDVIIIKKNNKNIYLRVKEDLKIYVTTGRFTTKLGIKMLLDNNKDAIRKMIESQSKKNKKN